MKADPDVQVMLRFAAGDESAFSILFSSYRKKVINYCYRFCGDRSLAEDLAQEVFLRVYRGASRYRPEARFSTWLFKIATNVCINAFRDKKRRAIMVSINQPIETKNGEMRREIEDPDPPAIDCMLERERQKQLQQAIAALPPQQRAALLLRIEFDFSYAEIAAQLKCSVNTVKTWIHRGRLALIETVKPLMDEEPDASEM